MSELINQLKRFNRKERFFLVGLALGNPDFKLGEEFRASLGKLLDGLSIPDEAFAAMDYHLEWLYAAIRQAEPGRPYADAEKFFKGNQEDIDLLIAFDEGPKTHLILLEAKGDSAWSNKQMKSKVARLKVVFDRVDSGRVQRHFVFLSKNPPRRLDTTDWPEWINPRHHLPMNVTGDQIVFRCDEAGRMTKSGEWWMIGPSFRSRSKRARI